MQQIRAHVLKNDYKPSPMPTFRCTSLSNAKSLDALLADLGQFIKFAAFAGTVPQAESLDTLQRQENPIENSAEQRDAENASNGMNEGQAYSNRSLPSETSVQERLQQESRKMKQSVRARQANRSAHKAGTKKSRQKGSAIEM